MPACAVQRALAAAGTVAVLTASLAVPVLAGRAAAQEGPRLVVTPNVGLSDGTPVVVEASGLTPGATVFVGVLNPDPSLGEGLSRVTLLPADDPAAFTGFPVDAGGGLRLEVPIVAGVVGTNPAAVCPPSPEQQSRGFVYCRIFVSAAENGDDAVQVDVAFGNQVPPPTTTTTAAPATTTTAPTTTTTAPPTTTTAPPTTTTTAPPPTTTTAPPPDQLASTGDATAVLAVVAVGLIGLGIIAVHLHDDDGRVGLRRQRRWG